MSDIKLTRPAASAVVSVEPQKGDNFAIEFDPSEAVLSREGTSLVFSFEDGAKVVVDGFYDVYSKDEMPSFSIGDVAIAGEDFFAAQDAGDLMPAAGPGQGQSQAAGQGGHWTDYGNSDILDGIGRLGALDIGFDSSVEKTEDLVAGGRRGDVDNVSDEPGKEPVSGGVGKPEAPAPVDNDVIIDVNEDETQGNSSVTVYEAGLAGGTGWQARGVLHINAPDGVRSVSIAGVAVIEDGVLCRQDGKAIEVEQTGGAGNPIGIGYLTVKDFDASTGKLTYEYTLRKAISHDESATLGKEGRIQVGETLEVVVTDVDGDVSTGSIIVNVVDGAPRLTPGTTKLDYEYASTSTDVDNPLPEMHFMGKNPSQLSTDLQAWKDQGVTLSSGKVIYNGDISQGIPQLSIDEHNNLTYTNTTLYNLVKTGLNVSGGKNALEISFNNDDKHSSQAVIFDLDQTAYGMEVVLGNLRTKQSDPSNKDAFDERATLLFYKYNSTTKKYDVVDGLLVTSTTQEKIDRSTIKLSSYLDQDGKPKSDIDGVHVDYQMSLVENSNLSGYYSGFDRVVLTTYTYDPDPSSATNSLENSDFLIHNIKFSTRLTDDAVISICGTVEADSGMDLFKEDIPHVMFESDQFTAVINGEEKKVNVFSKGTHVVALYDSNKTLFSGDVEDDGTFNIDLFEEFTIITTNGTTNAYDVKFVTAPDRDDSDSSSVARTSVSITTTSFNVAIVNGDHLVEESNEPAIVHVTVNTSTLVEGSCLSLHADCGGMIADLNYDFVWTNGAFVCAEEGEESVRLVQVSESVFEWQIPVASANDLKVTGTLTSSATKLSAEDSINCISGNDNAEYLYGTTGRDKIDGGKGDDFLDGGFGNDHLIGGSGKDRLYGGADNDRLEGGEGDDLLDGGTGHDELYGGNNADILFARAGNDFLDGGNGADKLYGEAGNDILVYDKSDTVINGGSGIDILVGANSNSNDTNVLNILQGIGIPNYQKITDVELAINVNNSNLSLTSMGDLSDNFGIKVNDDANSIILDSRWNIDGNHGKSVVLGTELSIATDLNDNYEFVTATSNDAELVVRVLIENVIQ